MRKGKRRGREGGRGRGGGGKGEGGFRKGVGEVLELILISDEEMRLMGEMV